MFYVVPQISPEITPKWMSPDPFTAAYHSITAVNNWSDNADLTTDQIIERVLVLAKAEVSEEEKARAFINIVALKITSLGDLTMSLADRVLKEDPSLMQNWWAHCESERSDFRSRLKELMKSPDKARTKHMAADFELLRKELLITGDLDDQGLAFCRFFPMTVEAAYKYVLQALYNKQNTRWKRLKTCGHCHSIFLRKISKSGGRPRDYCTPQCQKNADQKRALERQKSRAQRAKQLQRKRKRK